jgi:hypothetical protein
MSDNYDWRKDSYESWLLAISELRKRGVIEGRFEPINDAERALKESHPGPPSPSMKSIKRLSSI